MPPPPGHVILLVSRLLFYNEFQMVFEENWRLGSPPKVHWSSHPSKNFHVELGCFGSWVWRGFICFYPYSGYLFLKFILFFILSTTSLFLDKTYTGKPVFSSWCEVKCSINKLNFQPLILLSLKNYLLRIYMSDTLGFGKPCKCKYFN